MIEILNKFFTILSWVFLSLGILTMCVFFALYFIDEDINLYFYYAIASFLLGVVLFSMYRRIAHLGMHRIIYSLNSVHQQVAQMNAQFRERHSDEDEGEEKDKTES